MKGRRLAPNKDGSGAQRRIDECGQLSRTTAGSRDRRATQQENKENGAECGEHQEFVSPHTAKPVKLLIEKFLIGSGHEAPLMCRGDYIFGPLDEAPCDFLKMRLVS